MEQDVWQKPAQAVANDLNADVFLYSGPITEEAPDALLDEIGEDPATTAVLLLCTYGGSPDGAYRIARSLQRRREKVVMIVCGPCYSAGTLIAVGAHELVISDRGCLGPMDIQLRKQDELMVMSSGLTINMAFDSIRTEMVTVFETCMLRIQEGSGGAVSLKTAMDVSASFTSRVFDPIFAQIDPMRIGEHERAMRITAQYGRSLLAVSKNISVKALGELVGAYPSHSYVIDREEATALFKNVREPSPTETALITSLDVYLRTPLYSPVVKKLASPEEDEYNDADGERPEENGPDEGSPDGSGQIGRLHGADSPEPSPADALHS